MVTPKNSTTCSYSYIYVLWCSKCLLEWLRPQFPMK